VRSLAFEYAAGSPLPRAIHRPEFPNATARIPYAGLTQPNIEPLAEHAASPTGGDIQAISAVLRMQSPTRYAWTSPTLLPNMTKTFAQIERQIDSLRREAEKVRKNEVAGVITGIKEAIRYCDLTAKDLGFRGEGLGRAKAKAKGTRSGRAKNSAAMYKDPASGRTWTGHGRRPQWSVEPL